MNKDEVKNSAGAEKKRNPGECRICGFVTPFDPDSPGFVCPVCGSPTAKG